MPRATVNYALAATLLSQGLNYEQAAPQCGAKNGNSLKVGLLRRGVTQTATRRGDFAIQRATVIAKTVVSEESKALRHELANILANHTSALAKVPAKSNLKHIRQIGDAIEPLVRSAKIVHDWGNQEATGLVMSGLLTEETPQEAIEVESGTLPVVGEGEKPLTDVTSNSPSDTQAPNAS